MAEPRPILSAKRDHISLDNMDIVSDRLDVNNSTLEKHIKLMGPSIDQEFQDGICSCIIQFEETLLFIHLR